MGIAERMIDAFNSNMAQKIINGTDKVDLTPKKYYVYIVYDDIHGKRGIYASAESALARIWDDMCAIYEMDRCNPYPYDYNSEDRRGWEGAVWYEREEVIQ